MSLLRQHQAQVAAFYQKLESVGHKLKRDKSGEVDRFAFRRRHHNGPTCQRCNESWCQHCNNGEHFKECQGEESDHPGFNDMMTPLQRESAAWGIYKLAVRDCDNTPPGKRNVALRRKEWNIAFDVLTPEEKTQLASSLTTIDRRNAPTA